uniref:Uncharacterized protein n=1 Tax=Wuchereria bancrofti TaxID=6293 RepID=A0AAF5PWY0_WUCBA
MSLRILISNSYSVFVYFEDYYTAVCAKFTEKYRNMNKSLKVLKFLKVMNFLEMNKKRYFLLRVPSDLN